MGLLGKLEKPLRPSVVEFLHAQQCGFTNGIPKVCCGSLPKNLKIFKNAPDNDARRFVIKTTTTQKPTTSATSTKNMSEEKRRRMEEALNREFSSDFFDAGFDLFMFRRKKRDKNEQLEVEIR
ncbi:uncharacterized protein LOC126265676 [Aethina tumida]|uniref:uncharacterized protein LOC126265676 n=1 Tax=Aethina tumida TaxID=116153 RepID=UPI0021489533|nr:uncharacterized protein LOC126265676 [Aethina tumida]